MIKIKNIYYMLTYAFQSLNSEGYKNIETEEFEYVADLFAAILIKGVSNQVKRGLGREYILTSDSLSSPHGKINISSSLKNQDILKKKLVCDFDEFSQNFMLNRILKTTMRLLLMSEEVPKERKTALKRVMIYFADIEEVNIHSISWNSLRYNKNNATYKMLINICYLVISGMILTEEDGKNKLAKYVDDQKMYRLYEKFVLEYYKKHFPHFNPVASQIDWNVDDGNVDLLPTMKSDITLKHNDKTLIIDTKYYGHIYQTNYDKKSIHSANIYQIFTYVKNKDAEGNGKVSGVLLYAKTDDEDIDSDFMMNGNKISVKTLDLNTDFIKIKDKLNELVSEF